MRTFSPTPSWYRRLPLAHTQNRVFSPLLIFESYFPCVPYLISYPEDGNSTFHRDVDRFVPNYKISRPFNCLHYVQFLRWYSWTFLSTRVTHFLPFIQSPVSSGAVNCPDLHFATSHRTGTLIRALPPRTNRQSKRSWAELHSLCDSRFSSVIGKFSRVLWAWNVDAARNSWWADAMRHCAASTRYHPAIFNH
jgi:hypothetical protein